MTNLTDDELRALVEAAEARIKELEMALRPFVAATIYEGDGHVAIEPCRVPHSAWATARAAFTHPPDAQTQKAPDA